MSHKRMKKENTIAAPGIDTEIWIDYIEGEVGKSFRQDLELVLANNPQEKTAVEKLKNLKVRLKENPPVLPPDAVFNDLKSLIMVEVMNTQMEPVKKAEVVDDSDRFKEKSLVRTKGANRNYF